MLDQLTFQRLDHNLGNQLAGEGLGRDKSRSEPRQPFDCAIIILVRLSNNVRVTVNCFYKANKYEILF